MLLLVLVLLLLFLLCSFWCYHCCCYCFCYRCFYYCFVIAVVAVIVVFIVVVFVVDVNVVVVYPGTASMMFSVADVVKTLAVIIVLNGELAYSDVFRPCVEQESKNRLQ